MSFRRRKAREFRSLRAVAVLAACGALGATVVTGCPGEIDDPARFLTGTGTSTACDVEQLFADTCADTTCHNATDMAGMLDLVSPGVASRVVGQAASSKCPGEVLADPMNPEDSLLYVILLPSPPCQNQMPLIGDKLSEEQTQCVLEWIEGLESSSAVTTGGGMGGMPGVGGMGGMGGAGGAGGGMGGAGGN